MRELTAIESLFQSWLVEHRGIIFKVARSFARTPAELTELEQELRLQLWNSTRNFASQAKASTWVYRVCLNTAMTWRRGTTRRERRFDPDADIAQLGAPEASPAERAGDAEVLERLYAAIHAMSDLDRALVLLSLDGRTYAEISDVTGLTEGHVGVALSRARQRLANRMKGVTNELE